MFCNTVKIDKVKQHINDTGTALTIDYSRSTRITHYEEIVSCRPTTALKSGSRYSTQRPT